MKLAEFAPYYFFSPIFRKGNGGWRAVYRESESVVRHSPEFATEAEAIAYVPDDLPTPVLSGRGAPDGWTPGEVNPRQPRPDIENPAQRFAAQMAKAARNAVEVTRG